MADVDHEQAAANIKKPGTDAPHEPKPVIQIDADPENRDWLRKDASKKS